MSPEYIGDKFCRLDINMTIDKQLVDLEVQISNEGDFPERSLYYWAREYSSALAEGKSYSNLPRAIIISIVDFKMFDCEEFKSEYRALEVTRHTQLTDRMSLIYFELPKLTAPISEENILELWLKLFKAETDDDIAKIEALGVPIMNQAIEAYRSVAASPEFREMERMRSKARHDEAQAIENAEKRGEKRGADNSDRKWKPIVAQRDKALADAEAERQRLQSEVAELRAQIGNKN